MRLLFVLSCLVFLGTVMYIIVALSQWLGSVQTPENELNLALILGSFLASLILGTWALILYLRDKDG